MGGHLNKETPRDLKPAFDKYVKLKEGRNGCLSAIDFKNWLMEAFILGQDTKVTAVGIENVLSSNSIDRSEMNFDDFKKCIEDLANGDKRHHIKMINNLINSVENQHQ
ncbi:uncharacterized protein TNIN_432151 [Trichonephila inaurata madagascariensis]|uniref:Uncharacterized protein n=1 Tax=Trichonephila inaurata madagascariensis TaxID=2747483 RepID=A0A8X7BNV1_9ARAC|nr:uncharacterized protein TNIN_215121 [Trichonephila inaurata madagascariensis]GFY75136.1 uncharacterized protein TNIN_432151 [Trichonephila inaurata madagascariensis]